MCNRHDTSGIIDSARGSSESYLDEVLHTGRADVPTVAACGTKFWHLVCNRITGRKRAVEQQWSSSSSMQSEYIQDVACEIISLLGGCHLAQG